MIIVRKSTRFIGILLVAVLMHASSTFSAATGDLGAPSSPPRKGANTSILKTLPPDSPGRLSRAKVEYLGQENAPANRTGPPAVSPKTPKAKVKIDLDAFDSPDDRDYGASPSHVQQLTPIQDSAGKSLPNMADLLSSPERKYGVSPSTVAHRAAASPQTPKEALNPKIYLDWLNSPDGRDYTDLDAFDSPDDRDYGASPSDVQQLTPMKASAENTLPNIADLLFSPERKYGVSPSTVAHRAAASPQTPKEALKPKIDLDAFDSPDDRDYGASPSDVQQLTPMKASAENTLPNMADLFASPEKKYGASPSALSAEEVAAMQNFYVTSLRPNARIIPSSTRREPRRSPDAFSKFPTVQEEEQRPQINLAFLDSPESVRNAADRSPESTSLSRSLLDRLRSPMSPRSNMQRFLDMLDLAGPVPYLGEDPNFDEVQAEAIDDVVRMDIAGTQSSNARAFSLSLLDAESIGAVNKSASQASTALAARSESVASIIGEDIGSVARIGSRDTKSISEEVSRISLQAEAIRNIDRIDFARTQSSASRSSILPELKSDLIDNINKIQFSKTRSVAANSSSATHIRSDPISNIHKIPSAVSKVVILDQSIFSINSEIIPHVDKIQSKVSKAVLSKSSNVTCAKAEEISKVPAIVASTTSSANITPSVPLGLIAEPMGRVQKLPIATSEPIASKASTSSSIVAVPIVDIAVVPSAVSKTNASKPSSISEIKAEAIAIVGKMPQNNTERSNEKPSILKLLGAEAVGDIVPLVSSPTKTSLAKPSTLTTVKAESIPDVAKVKSLDTESSNISAETIYSGSYSSYSEWPPENYNSSGGGESHCPPNCGPGIDLKKPIKMASGNGFGNAFGSIGGAIDLRLFGRGVGIAAGEGKKIEKGFWEKWLHSYTEQTTQGKKDPGYNMRQKGVATGLDAEVRDNLTLGVAYTNMFSSSSSKEILHDTEKARLQIASLYGEYNPSERSMFKAKLHYGQAKINHKIDAPMLKSKGDTKGKLWKASIDAIYGYNYKDLIISPKISGIYDSFHIDAFDQKTSNGKIYIPNRKGHKFAAAIGVGVKKEYKVKQINIVPKIHFNVNQVLYKNEESPELDFSSGEAVVNLFKLGNNDRTTYNVGGYINMNRSEMFEIGVGYDHYFRKGYKNHSSYVSMFLRF